MVTNIDPHRYTPLVVEAQATSRVLLRQGGKAVVFYTTAATHELRVRAHEFQRVYTLMQDVRFAHGFVLDDVAHIYVVTLQGDIKLVTYRFFGDPTPVVYEINHGNKAHTLHAIHQHGWFFLTASDGGQIYIIQARDAKFSLGVQRTVLYSNALDPMFYVDKPVVGLHPDDYKPGPLVSRLTVGVERMRISTGAREVGYFIHETTLDVL